MKVKVFKQNTFLSLEKDVNDFLAANPSVTVAHTNMVPQGDSLTLALFYE